MSGINVPAILFAGASAICLVLAVWFAVEVYLLWTRSEPITWYIRNQVSWHMILPWAVSTAVFCVVTMGITHFVFDVGSK